MPAPPAKTGIPTVPSARYKSSARAPRRLPSTAPVKSTARGCSVIGTGHHGIATRAESATKALKTTTITISKSHERERGNKTSTSVARGWVASEDIFLLLGISCCVYKDPA
jgi:hypothetical protein